MWKGLLPFQSGVEIGIFLPFPRLLHFPQDSLPAALKRCVWITLAA